MSLVILLYQISTKWYLYANSHTIYAAFKNGIYYILKIYQNIFHYLVPLVNLLLLSYFITPLFVPFSNLSTEKRPFWYLLSNQFRFCGPLFVPFGSTICTLGIHYLYPLAPLFVPLASTIWYL